ncbi:hypothetical protein F5141DRAFT_1065253 [Pisolithus sp. B1]|nr:hypothetical protein F5141DRAFT_1065253 [Pisolithus sp. B1]
MDAADLVAVQHGFEWDELALYLKEEVNYFVWSLGMEECEGEKWHKLMDLELTESEWEHIQLLLSLLVQAKKAQQAFSTEQGLTMHTVLLVLEVLFQGLVIMEGVSQICQLHGCVGGWAK